MIPWKIFQIVSNIPLVNVRIIYSQQDGAPAHNYGTIRNFLNEHLNNRWKGTHEAVGHRGIRFYVFQIFLLRH